MKYLVVLLWPAVMVVIFSVAFLLTRRARQSIPAAARASGSRPQAQPGSHEAPPGKFAGSPWLLGAGQMLGLIVIGALIAFGVMALLGLLVVHHGLTIDQPIYNWLVFHQVSSWAAIMNRLTKIGNSWTCWAAAVAAAVCMAVTWRTKRWLPPIVLTAVIVVDHYTTLALRHTFERLGPPDSPLGTYPSGGCDRVILFYGLIAYLLWREFSGQRKTALWAGAVVAALGFNEAYSRVYLGLHWFTDAASGLLYGSLLLAAFIIAVRLVAGPAVVRQGGGDRIRAAVLDPVTSGAGGAGS